MYNKFVSSSVFLCFFHYYLPPHHTILSRKVDVSFPPCKNAGFSVDLFFNPGREKRRPSLQSAFLSSIRFSLPGLKKKGRRNFFVKMEILFLGPQILTLFLAFLGFWVEKMTKNTKCTYPHQNRYFRS